MEIKKKYPLFDKQEFSFGGIVNSLEELPRSRKDVEFASKDCGDYVLFGLKKKAEKELK